MTNYINGWLRLLRLPNLFTVPGDVLAGMAVMVCCTPSGREPTVSQVVAACLASVLLYAAGLLDNDLVDQKQDAKERPHRPLPSGVVSISHVVLALAACCVGALLLGHFMLTTEAVFVEAALIAAIFVYNRIKQPYPLMGGLMMGLCRGLNLLFGAAVLANGLFGANMIWSTVLAGCWALYIFVVTLVSQRETTGDVPPWLAFLPAGVLVASIGIFGVVFRPMQPPSMVAIAAPLVLATWLATRIGYRICRERTPGVVQKSIGLLIRNLLLLQSAACYSWNAPLALGLLILWPLHHLLCRWYYAS